MASFHSGNLVRGFHVGDRKLFMEKYYDPEKYMELGTCFVREDILLRDGVHKIDRKVRRFSIQNLLQKKSVL